MENTNALLCSRLQMHFHLSLLLPGRQSPVKPHPSTWAALAGSCYLGRAGKLSCVHSPLGWHIADKGWQQDTGWHAPVGLIPLLSMLLQQDNRILGRNLAFPRETKARQR